MHPRPPCLQGIPCKASWDAHYLATRRLSSVRDKVPSPSTEHGARHLYGASCRARGARRITSISDSVRESCITPSLTVKSTNNRQRYHRHRPANFQQGAFPWHWQQRQQPAHTSPELLLHVFAGLVQVAAAALLCGAPVAKRNRDPVPPKYVYQLG
ncbi:uncharacterized protein LOC144104333 [Amblyomma americanum]